MCGPGQDSDIVFGSVNHLWVGHSWTRSTNYQSTYCNSFPIILSYFKHSSFNNIPENSSEPPCLAPNQYHSPWPWI